MSKVIVWPITPTQNSFQIILSPTQCNGPSQVRFRDVHVNKKIPVKWGGMGRKSRCNVQPGEYSDQYRNHYAWRRTLTRLTVVITW